MLKCKICLEKIKYQNNFCMSLKNFHKRILINNIKSKRNNKIMNKKNLKFKISINNNKFSIKINKVINKRNLNLRIKIIKQLIIYLILINIKNILREINNKVKKMIKL